MVNKTPHHICHKLSEMIFWAMNYYLVKKKFKYFSFKICSFFKIYTGIHIALFFIRRLKYS